ncbi:hypothetical protein L9F63_009384, partial [Diploptera punctata]
ELELVTDPVCLKPTCPCILKPASQVLDVFNLGVVIMAIIAGLMLPYYAFFVCLPITNKDETFTGPKCEGAENARIIRFCSLFVFATDLVVQLLTAVRTRDSK